MATGKMTKAQIISELAEMSNLSKREVADVFENLKVLIKRELGPRGPREFVIPDLVKLKLKKTKAQTKKVRNPATQEEYYKDFPASKKVRATPLKKLKDLVL